MRKRGRRALSQRYGTRSGGALASGRIQVLLFPRGDWSIEDALVWAGLHKFNTDEYDITDSYVRVHPYGHQKKARRVKTIPYASNGIRAVVEWR
jgi:hypothetical protein